MAAGTEAVGLPAPRSKERDEGRLALVATLNGLERLAIGIDSNLYDLGTIRKLGGTVIFGNYEYGEEYVKGRRMTGGARRKTNTFVHLERLVADLAREPSTEDVSDMG